MESTLDEIYRPLMNAPSMIAGRCFICGQHMPLNQHHIVWRSWGSLYVGGRELPKPTITLCGFGNNLKDANGRYYCHGLAHQRMLHFRFVLREELRTPAFDYTMKGAGHLEYLITDEPTDYQKALELEGWRRVTLLREDER